LAATRSRVAVDIYDIAGRRVSSLMDAVMPAGPVSLNWDGRDGTGSRVASGIYFYRVSVDQQSYVGKMTVLK
jgi:flagellar hook assembly protein FlgD